MIYLIDYNNQGHRQTYGEIYENNITDSKYIVLDSFKIYFHILFTKNNVYFLTGDDNFISTFFIGLFRSTLNKKTFMNYYHLDFFFKKDIKSKIKKILLNQKYNYITSFYFNEFKIDDLKDSNFTYIPEFFFGFDFSKEQNLEKPYTFFYGGAISKRKGFNKLIEAFYQFSLKSDKKFLLKIVGTVNQMDDDVFLKYNSLVDKSKLIHINERLNDYEFDKEIYMSDCVIIPYLKSFNSNSGILAKAIYYNKQIIASNHGYIGSFLKKYNIGKIFNIDNIEEFLINIDTTIECQNKVNYIDLQEEHNMDNVFKIIKEYLK